LSGQAHSRREPREGAVKPLFPGYLFARFKIKDAYHKIRYTQGVREIVRFGAEPAIVGDEVVELIRARQDGSGSIAMQDQFHPGEVVLIKQGPLRNLAAVFQRSMSDAGRVMLLLQTVEYQAQVVVDRSCIEKADSAARAN
jgi:transcriptional antiterminator RfaH